MMDVEEDAVDLDAVGGVTTVDEVEAVADELEELSLKLKGKKKKKKKKKKVVDDGEADQGHPDPNEDGKYSYQQMLDRIFTLLKENNPNLQNRRAYKMVPPQLGFIGSKKTMWSNFEEMCKLMRRTVDHAMSFFMVELGTQGSLDKNNRMVIKGRFKVNQIQTILKKYIGEYVRCSMCHTPETTLQRDQVTRLYFLECENCGSHRSVAPIKTLFHATSRADRRHAKRTGS
uniref:Eukaryotic translation initiation factor 2 subunit 2 n=1 Tax=Hirondellea gigas TaxID=1518452 RepID=A0A6A7G5V8_9CRUS